MLLLSVACVVILTFFRSMAAVDVVSTDKDMLLKSSTNLWPAEH